MNTLNKYKTPLIIVSSVLLLLLGILIFLKIWQAYQTGNLSVTAEQTDVAYQISGDPNTYTGSERINSLKKGEYKIKAFGLTPGIYLEKTINIKVKGNRTTKVDIKLDIDSNGYNHGGVEGP